VTTSPEFGQDRPELLRTGRRLEIFTIAYNSLEGLIGIAAGLYAGSIALMGFGIDSAIEVISGATLLWRLNTHRDHADAERAERISLKVVGISFFLLAVYILADSAKTLIRHEAPGESTPGIILAAVSLIVMPLLVRAKRKVAKSIRSDALDADAAQTLVCARLSAILVGGLALNAWFGWWWADPVAALAMLPIIVKEGWEALHGDPCRDH
jgi:divalent metal cation (Fe/Co/Zn/Cd) transporter